MNTLYSQFKEALTREKNTITSFYSNTTYPVLFRRSDDNKSDTDYSVIFYEVSTPLYQGQLITYKGEHFIIMSKEAVENNVYYKSSILKCNIEFPVLINSVPTLIPFYAYHLGNPKAVETNVLTTIDGTGEIISEATDAVKAIAIDYLINLMGRWFEVTNAYNLNGISHVFMKIGLAPPDNFILDVTNTGDILDLDGTKTSQITVITKNNTTLLTGQTVTYSSSDSAIATVSSTGLVTGISTGSAIITVTWVEKGITETIAYTVSSTQSPTYTMSLVASGDFVIGSSSYRTVYATLKDGTGAVVPTWTANWSINYNGIAQSKFIIAYDGVNIKIKIVEDYDLIGSEFFLTCTTSDSLATATLKCTISV